MSDFETRVREAAEELHKAIADAIAAGFHVVWPGRHADLPAIAISETGAVKRPAAAVPDAAPASPQPDTNHPTA